MVDEFHLDGPPALSRSTVDRDERLRADTELQIRTWNSARLLVVDDRGRAPVLLDERGASLEYRATAALAAAPPDTAVLLGEQDSTTYWAARADATAESTTDGLTWRGLRDVGALLGDTDAGLLTTAVAALSWHDSARFCAVCGSPTRPVRAGWARACSGCGREEYPRTDPAIIVLVHDGNGHVLLARQPVWPPERYSVLAGFVEAGESLEGCVVREVAEEAGVAVRAVRYLGSQPWPFPRSVMIGFAALAEPGAPLHPAEGEIEDARWVHRDEVRAAIEAGGAAPGLVLPFETSIARRMLEAWAGS
jgi:NAD+ diphosphatase